MNPRDAIHLSHCCIEHGCKYGRDDICVILNRKMIQTHVCEECWAEGIKTIPMLFEFRRIQSDKVFEDAEKSRLKNLGNEYQETEILELKMVPAPKIVYDYDIHLSFIKCEFLRGMYNDRFDEDSVRALLKMHDGEFITAGHVVDTLKFALNEEGKL